MDFVVQKAANNHKQNNKKKKKKKKKSVTTLLNMRSAHTTVGSVVCSSRSNAALEGVR